MKSDDEILEEFYRIGNIANQCGEEMVKLIKASSEGKDATPLLNQIGKKILDMIDKHDFNAFGQLVKDFSEMTKVPVPWIDYVLNDNNEMEEREGIAAAFGMRFTQTPKFLIK